MSESDDGFSVAATRQKPGRFLKVWAFPPGPLGGRVKSPAAMLWALSIVAPGKVIFDNVSHAALAAIVGAGIKLRAAGTTDIAAYRIFMRTSSSAFVANHKIIRPTLPDSITHRILEGKATRLRPFSDFLSCRPRRCDSRSFDFLQETARAFSLDGRSA